MARPLSDDRRAALLTAAVGIFADQGIAAPTSLISKTAGVSEGSFFTYFKTKDDLVNALYREIRLGMAGAMMADFPARAGVQARLEHVFTRWVRWGLDHPQERRALRHLSMSRAIRPEVRAENDVLFAEVERIQDDALRQRRLHVPPPMAAQALKALAEMTMDMAERNPRQAKALTAVGFQMLWGALSSRPLERS